MCNYVNGAEYDCVTTDLISVISSLFFCVISHTVALVVVIVHVMECGKAFCTSKSTVVGRFS